MFLFHAHIKIPAQLFEPIDCDWEQGVVDVVDDVAAGGDINVMVLVDKNVTELVAVGDSDVIETLASEVYQEHTLNPP